MKRFFLFVFFAVMSASLFAQGELILSLSDTSLTAEQVAAKCSNPRVLMYPLSMKDKIPKMQCNVPSAGRFSVAAGRQVEFAPGNLQFNAAIGTHQCADGTTQPGTWRFAEHQWDFVGDANSGTVYIINGYDSIKCNNELIAEDYDGWIDLFGWGTSGWNSGANAYQPWSTSTEFSDYYPGGNANNNLIGDYANADWGVYNQIGSDAPGTWRTLTTDEWVYLFRERINAEKLFGLGNIEGITGLIILPDNWNWLILEGLVFNPSIENGLAWDNSYYHMNGNGFLHNTYTYEQWKLMESNGAVFLYETDGRDGTIVAEKNKYGGYWSVTSKGFAAYIIHFIKSAFWVNSWNNRKLGFGVRLVRDVPK